MDDLSASETPEKTGIIRRLYHWTISWADRPGGNWALFAIAFAESSFFPIPPDVLLLALCFGARKKWAKYALIATAGSVLGGIAGWLIGWGLREPVALPLLGLFDSTGEVRGKIETWYEAYGFLGILIAAITPIPYKVFTIFSGMMSYSLPGLIVASIVGRGFRFFVVAGIVRLFGPTVRPFIEKHLEWCFLAFGILLVLGIVALKFLH
ncbi:YqaA family protein [Haloferula sargassicola]|uniref:DedA family protein n=1 Tax=Haloferula sargassicola TaxID=490096 RepID=A0ABP9UJV4_9BACT